MKLQRLIIETTAEVFERKVKEALDDGWMMRPESLQLAVGGASQSTNYRYGVIFEKPDPGPRNSIINDEV